MSPQRRATLGALIGLVIFAADAIATLIRAIFHPYIAQRLTSSAMIAMLLFLILFVVVGALAGYLWGIKVAACRYLAIGAIGGSLGGITLFTIDVLRTRNH